MPPGWSGHGNIDSNEPRKKFQGAKKNVPTTEKEKKMKGRSLKKKERRERRINQSIVWTLSAISSTPRLHSSKSLQLLDRISNSTKREVMTTYMSLNTACFFISSTELKR
jgi:hypothetical protein